MMRACRSHVAGEAVIAADSSRRAVVAVGILVMHVAALYALSKMGPQLKSVVANIPVMVRFVAESQPKPPQQPPQVKLVSPEIATPVPEMPLVEIPTAAAPSERAITLNVARRVETAPVADRSVPKMIATVEYLREPSPRYPAQSRKMREQGLVVLRVIIDEQGLACDIGVESSSGHARLDAAAKDAVARAAFRPYIEDGLPRRALVLIPIEFSLNRSAA